MIRASGANAKPDPSASGQRTYAPGTLLTNRPTPIRGSAQPRFLDASTLVIAVSRSFRQAWHGSGTCFQRLSDVNSVIQEPINSRNPHSQLRHLTSMIGARGHRPVEGFSGVPPPGSASRTRCPRTLLRAGFRCPGHLSRAARGQLDAAGWQHRSRFDNCRRPGSCVDALAATRTPFHSLDVFKPRYGL